ncbi:MAG TPA: hypothetical protein VK578_15715 [Edaphobacter sp.]|nr:hypothetical protein [Edaphobacter sp.]
MTPQSNIMVVAPIIAGREAELRRLLASMNREPGLVDPDNPLVPFGKITTLHFARFVVLEDKTREDLLVYGAPLPNAINSLAFLCDCDGTADVLRRDLVTYAEAGLRQIFSFCESFKSNTDLLRWMEEHEQAAATTYNNWLGRTVLQVREEEALRKALQLQLRTRTIGSPRQAWQELRAFVANEKAAGRLSLTSAAPTPLVWSIENLLNCVGVPLSLLLLSPILLIYLPIFLIQLRIRESRDPVIAPRPTLAHAKSLAVIEDRVITNQFSAYGNIKPGLFRRWTLAFLLFAVQYTTRHIYNRGFLARVNTIHFARWVFLDNRTRLFFASNYDGGLETYMGDFINKVAWGLNIVFSNGVGYPKTNWLVMGGAKDELTFKDFLRRHQLPTDVWYDSTPGITAFDMERNSRIRNGIEQESMTDDELSEWIGLL